MSNHAKTMANILMATKMTYKTGATTVIIGEGYEIRVEIIKWRWWLHKLGFRQRPFQLTRRIRVDTESKNPNE